MAAYAGTPTVIRSWTTVRNTTKFVSREIQITLTAMGTVTNPISAASLGFARIDEVGALRKSDNSAIYNAAPSIDGSLLLVEASNAPGDITGTFQAIITGQPSAV